ncbi:MAG: hypothetical protein JNL98_22090 [Bryobacterales bacterium]|nr:hypothetical protein [Bryobacterales bacterium]
MLCELQQQRVWEGLVSAEAHAQYFAEYSNRYYRYHRTATWATLLLSTGVFLSLLADWLPASLLFVRPLLALFAAGVSLYSLVAQNQKMAMDSSDLFYRWNKLAHDYRLLWEDMYREDALAVLGILDERRIELSKGATAFPNNVKAMSRIQSAVQQELHESLSSLSHARAS